MTAQQRSNSSCRGKRRRNVVWFSSLLVAVRPTRRLAGDVGRLIIFHTWRRVRIMPSFKSGGRRPRKAPGASELAGSWGGWLLREKLSYFKKYYIKCCRPKWRHKGRDTSRCDHVWSLMSKDEARVPFALIGTWGVGSCERNFVISRNNAYNVVAQRGGIGVETRLGVTMCGH